MPASEAAGLVLPFTAWRPSTRPSLHLSLHTPVHTPDMTTFYDLLTGLACTDMAHLPIPCHCSQAPWALIYVSGELSAGADEEEKLFFCCEEISDITQHPAICHVLERQPPGAVHGGEAFGKP